MEDLPLFQKWRLGCIINACPTDKACGGIELNESILMGVIELLGKVGYLV
ncbi:hypothetical protein ES703_26847 [subsurface metagenome]